MKRNKVKKNNFCALKLDIMKAYDRVEWAYSRAIMTRMGFVDAWVNRIMACVETVSFLVRVNGVFSEQSNIFLYLPVMCRRA